MNEAARDMLYGMARGVFGPNVGIGIADPLAPATDLLPAELVSTDGMVDKRVREFAAGRTAARAAMAQIAFPPAAIPMGKDRAPVWPDGMVGSISHCDSSCVAVVSNIHAALGVDLEPDKPLPGGVPKLVLDASERGWIAEHGSKADFDLGRLIFCAKETIYKAQYPSTHVVAGFDALHITVDLDSFTYTAKFTQKVGGFKAGHLMKGQFSTDGGLILSGIAL